MDAVSNEGTSNKFEISFRQCIIGEKAVNGQCIKCPQGEFLLTYGTECNTCPTDATCPGGSVIDTFPGFWRELPSTSTIRRCPYAESCLGKN